MVEIITSDPIITEDYKDQMAQNIADAIISHARTVGITPEESYATTEIVYVREWYSDKQAIEHI